MKKQPLHYACDTLYNCTVILEDIEDNMNKMQLLTAYRQKQDLKEKLDKLLSVLRNKALRDEGEYRI